MKSRRLLVGLLAGLTALAAGLSGCGGGTNTTSTTSVSAGSTADAASTATTTATPADTATTTGATTTTAPASDKTYTIGVAVIIAHPSLQAAQDGFEAVLTEEGLDYTVISQNAQGDTANAATIASSFAANKDIDLIFAISTPIALAMANAEATRPIIFSAVTDPVDVRLTPSWEQAGANVTGTSDLNPGAKPVELVTRAKPETTTIGVLYSSSEPNSLTQVKAFQEEATALGVTLKTQAITSAAEISVGLEALAGVDAILIPTDNTVVAAMASVVAFGQDRQIPVFCADTDSVSHGTVAARGVSYTALGRRAGQMAVSILRDGVPISSIPPEAPVDTELVVNPDAATSFGLTLPAGFTDGATIVSTQP